MATDTVAQALHDAAAYPVLVMDADAPGAQSGGGGAHDVERLVDGALRAVLGARTRVGDAAGFRAALARSFVPTEVDGRTVYRNVPNGTLVDVLDEGELSGYQATLLAHARDVVERGLPLLDGLRSLAPCHDVEDAQALSSVARSAVLRLRDEFGRRDGPRSLLVEEQLRVLLGDPATSSADPDEVGGVLGTLRDQLALTAGEGSRANTVDEEQQVTSFRLLVEYVTGLRSAWTTAAPYFGTGSSSRAFVSGRLRRLDLTMQTVAEAVDRVRRQLDSVYVGEAERRTSPLSLPSRPEERLTVEDLLEWAADVVSPDSAALLRDGGRIVIADSLLPTATIVRDLLTEAASVPLPGGLGAARVTAAFTELATQFDGLVSELGRLTPSPPQSGGGGGPATGSVRVPDVVGRTLKAARKTLKKHGLRLGLGRAETADTGAVGHVLATEPAAGTVVEDGSEVLVHYLAALTQATVPAVVGEPVARATELVEDARLVVGDVLYASDQDASPGTVIKAVPAEGTVVSPGQPVHLTVSTGDPDDVYDLLCGLAPLVGTVAREGWAGVGRLWRAASADDPDCPEELRSTVQVMTVLAQLLEHAVDSAVRGRGGGPAPVPAQAARALHDLVQRLADALDQGAAAAAAPAPAPAPGAAKKSPRKAARRGGAGPAEEEEH